MEHTHGTYDGGIPPVGYPRLQKRVRVTWRSRLTLVLLTMVLTLAVSYRIAHHRVVDGMKYMNNGTELLQKGYYHESLDAFDRALAQNDDLMLAWTGKGLSLLYLGRYTEALAQYDHAIEIDSTFVIAWNGRGISLTGLGRLDEALDCFNRILDINPNDMHAIRIRTRIMNHLSNTPAPEDYI